MRMYLLLVYRNEDRWEAMPPGERLAFEEACQASEGDLIRSLQLLDARRLQNMAALKVSRLHGDVSLTLDSDAGQKERLIQLLFIRARDLNAAIQIASKMPQAQGGYIEVRSIAEGKV